MKCQFCKISGGNMRKCKKCGQTYCRSCATKGKGPYLTMDATLRELPGVDHGEQEVILFPIL